MAQKHQLVYRFAESGPRKYEVSIADLGDHKDVKEYVDELQKRAKAKEAEAMRKLGDLYAQGELITQSFKKAVKWYERAVSFD